MKRARQTVVIGEAAVEYVLVQSSRRHRTVSMQLERDGQLVVRAPYGTPMYFIDSFVRARSRWIARRLAEHRAHPQQDVIEDLLSGLDVTLPYRGVETPVVFDRDDVRRAEAWMESRQIRVVAPPDAEGLEVRGALVAWYKQRALYLIERRVEAWVDAVGRAPRRIQVRSQKTQWGSCGEDGTLRFNWQLAMVPPSLLEYVVVHELTHLRIRHHGASFWRRMAELMPNYETHRARLREFARRLPL